MSIFCKRKIAGVHARKRSTTEEKREREAFRSKVQEACGDVAKQTHASTHYSQIYPPAWAPAPSYPERFLYWGLFHGRGSQTVGGREGGRNIKKGEDLQEAVDDHATTPPNT